MLRVVLPWILVALVVGAWIGSTVFVEDDAAPPIRPMTDEEVRSRQGAEAAALRKELADLRARVDVLSERGEHPAPELAGRAQEPSGRRQAQVAPRTPAFLEREAAARRRAAAEEKREAWLRGLRSLKDPGKREAALAEIRLALDGEDEALRLAALMTAASLKGTKHDDGGLRAVVLPHASHEDPQVRRAALGALLRIDPNPADLDLWLAEVPTVVDRATADETLSALVRFSDGEIRDKVADAVLDLLRDGSSIEPWHVMDGLQGAKAYDARVEARLIEIVRASPFGGRVDGAYFRWVALRLDPKSDAVLDLMLDRIRVVKGDVWPIIGSFRLGLSDAQKDRAADRLLEYAEEADAAGILSVLVSALEHVAYAAQAPRIEALARYERVPQHVRENIDKTARAARARR